MEYMKIKDEGKEEGTADIEDPHPRSGSRGIVNNPKTAIQEGSEWKRKSLVTIALTVLTSSQGILIAWSKRAGKYDYSVTSANFLVETLKCALSLIALVRTWEREGITEDNK